MSERVRESTKRKNEHALTSFGLTFTARVILFLVNSFHSHFVLLLTYPASIIFLP